MLVCLADEVARQGLPVVDQSLARGPVPRVHHQSNLVQSLAGVAMVALQLHLASLHLLHRGERSRFGSQTSVGSNTWKRALTTMLRNPPGASLRSGRTPTRLHTLVRSAHPSSAAQGANMRARARAIPIAFRTAPRETPMGATGLLNVLPRTTWMRCACVQRAHPRSQGARC